MSRNLRQQKERGIWDKLASGYDKRTLKIYQNAYERSVQKIQSVVTKNDHVLEIGCGTGIVSLGIAPFVKSVIATDISPQMIEIANQKKDSTSVSNVRFETGDGYSFSFAEETFDIVLIFNTLHVLQEPATVLRETHRLLKSGGKLCTATDCYAEPVPFPIRLKLSLQKLLKFAGVIPFMSWYKKNELNLLFEDNNFIIKGTDILHAAPVNYYVLAAKE